ncbi:hypothetical protein PIB30_046266, partial [Stylosanthes scabra]|nr:hypothetical protein [Stylosanthes scabra]
MSEHHSCNFQVSPDHHHLVFLRRRQHPPLMVVHSHSSLLLHYPSSSLLINPPVVVAAHSGSSQLVTSPSPLVTLPRGLGESSRRLPVIAASSGVAAVGVMVTSGGACQDLGSDPSGPVGVHQGPMGSIQK